MHAYCETCAGPFIENVISKPPEQLHQGPPCAVCPGHVPLGTLPPQHLLRVASALGGALAPKPTRTWGQKIVDALILACPGCNQRVDPNPAGCNHFTCESCLIKFCGCCFKMGCKKNHGSIYDMEARRVGQAAVTKEQLREIFKAMPKEERKPALAHIIPSIDVFSAIEYTKMIRNMR